MVSEIRRNHLLERELAKLDKRIALLIKNRGNIQEEISTTKGHKSAKVVHEKSEISARKLEVYFLKNKFFFLNQISFNNNLSIIKIYSIYYKRNQNIWLNWYILWFLNKWRLSWILSF